LLLDQQKAFQRADNDAEERNNIQVKEFTLKELLRGSICVLLEFAFIIGRNVHLLQMK
jgi:hypothetical protein